MFESLEISKETKRLCIIGYMKFSLRCHFYNSSVATVKLLSGIIRASSKVDLSSASFNDAMEGKTQWPLELGGEIPKEYENRSELSRMFDYMP